jgi:hypothetical protein
VITKGKKKKKKKKQKYKTTSRMNFIGNLAPGVSNSAFTAKTKWKVITPIKMYGIWMASGFYFY